MLHSQKSQPTGTGFPGPTEDEASIHVSDLFRAKFSTAESAHDARLMVRAWFLCYVLQADGGLVTPTGNLADNCALYEMIDEFFSEHILCPLQK